MHPYLRRRAGEEPVTYPSAEVEGVLKRTLGVPIFQEQVMQLAIVAAGFTPGEADQLRRAMAAWKRKGGLGHFEERLITGMRERGYAEEFARRIFQQILGFGEYGFPESHAASFALLVYVSAWLKRHEPAAFAAALINSQPMGFYAPSQIVQDAQRHGVEVRPIDVRASDWDCTLERRADESPGPALRLGLRLVKGLAEEAGAAAGRSARAQAGRRVRERAAAGRAGRPRSSCDGMPRGGGRAGGSRWASSPRGVAGGRPRGRRCRSCRRCASPKASRCLRAPREGEDIVADYAHTGLTLRRHPVAVLRDQLAARGFVDSAQLRELTNGSNVRTAGLVITRQRPGSAEGVTFVTLEDEHGSINLIVWRDVAERQRQALIGSRLHGAVRQAAAGRRGHARDRASARRPESLARPVALSLARFSLTLAWPRAVTHVVVVEVAQQLRRPLLLHHAFELAPRGFRAFRRAAFALVEVLDEAIDIEGVIAPDGFLGVFVLELVR